MDRREVMEKHRKQWNSLSDDKTVKWIRKAFQDEHRYGTEVEKYRSDHPDFHPDPVKTVLSKAEKELKDRYDGKPERPPNSGYSLFSRIMLRQLTDFPSRAKMAEISRRWKQLSELDREAYNKKIQKANAIYKEKYTAFLNSLPEKERQKIESDAKVSNKKRAVNHTTVDNTKNDISELEAIDGALPAMIYFQQEKYVVFRQRHPKQDVMKMLAREYNELSEKKKEKYKKIAEEAKMAYDEVSTTKGKESGGDASGGTRGGGGGGRKQLFIGEPRKPPQSGYGLFSTEMLSVLTNVDPKHRMSEIAKRWKAMTNAEKEKYKKKVQDLMRKYNRNMQKFITSLSAAEFQEYEKHRKSNIKSKSKKQIKPEQPKFQMDPRIW